MSKHSPWIDDNGSGPLAATAFRIFSKSIPWRIVHTLRKNGKTLVEISQSLNMTQQDVLPELMTLHKAGLISAPVAGGQACYLLADKDVLQALGLVEVISRKRGEHSSIPAGDFGIKNSSSKVSPRKGRPSNRTAGHYA